MNVSNIHGDSILVDTIKALDGINQKTDSYQYVKTGILRKDSGNHDIYGIAVGKITTTKDGALDTTQGEYVEITPGRVSFMQNGTEVAYMTGKKLYIKNGDIEASDFKFVDGVSIKAQLEKLAKSVDNNGFDFEIDGGGWLRLTNASSAAYAVELGSDGALRLVANSGDIFLNAGLATIQMHHDTGKVAISGLDATPVFG